MSIFLFGGNFGFSIGPLIAGMVLNQYGAHGTLILLGGAAILYPVLAFRLFRLHVKKTASLASGEISPQQVKPPSTVPPAIMPIILLGLIIILRGWAMTSITTYLPQQFLARGEDVARAGQALFLYSLAGAGGGFSAGFFSDRIGIHRMVILALVLAVPLMIVMHFASGVGLLVVISLTGLCLLSTLPLTLLLGQQLFPSRPGVMTGVTLGFTFVAGGIGAAITGLIAEHAGLSTAFLWLPALPLLGAIMALALYLTHRANGVAVAASAA
jgi:FSR family fosmidomycin resistance protein-like MFS transporter